MSSVWELRVFVVERIRNIHRGGSVDLAAHLEGRSPNSEEILDFATEELYYFHCDFANSFLRPDKAFGFVLGVGPLLITRPVDSQI